jgi:hypothetical protein
MEGPDLDLYRVWARDGLAAIREMMPLMAPLGAYRLEDPDAATSVRDLVVAAARSAESVMLLCEYGQLWDAELAMRTTVEASLKFCYLLQAPHTFAERYREYAHDLYDIGRLRDHGKISGFISELSKLPSRELRPLTDRLLDPAELAKLQARLPKPVRAAVEGRWGFTGMIGALHRSNDPLFEGVLGMAHNYSMASHIMHADPIGTMMPLERDRRSPTARDASHAVHLARIIVDAVSCHRLRLKVAYRFVGMDPKGLSRADDLLESVGRRHDEAYRKFLAVEYPTGTPAAV